VEYKAERGNAAIYRTPHCFLDKSINSDFRFTHPGVPRTGTAANITRELHLMQLLLEFRQ
jgi:hypothetical protein